MQPYSCERRLLAFDGTLDRCDWWLGAVSLADRAAFLGREVTLAIEPADAALQNENKFVHASEWRRAAPN